MNMGWVDEYAKLDNIGQPDMIEPKGYVFVGSSRKRLTNSNMPSFAEIREFAEQLGKLTGKEIIKEKADSRVILLGQPGMETNVMKLYGLE
jgi:tRNA wybutosine-synthesizing protein 1